MANVLDSTAEYLLASLRVLARRQSVLAGNLANAHTPGYARVDVDFGATLRALYEESDGVPASGVSFLRSDGTEPDPELEAAEMSRTALQAMALTQLLAAKLELLRAAILEGRR